MANWHPSLRRLAEQRGHVETWQACEKVLGFPPLMVTMFSEVLTLERAFNDDSQESGKVDL